MIFNKILLLAQNKHIAETVAEYLKENNIRFAGTDVIGENVIEINITFPRTLKLINDKCEQKQTDILVKGSVKEIKEK